MSADTLIGLNDAKERRELTNRVDALEKENQELRDAVDDLRRMILQAQSLVISSLNGDALAEARTPLPAPGQSADRAPTTKKQVLKKKRPKKTKAGRGRATRCIVVQSDSDNGYVLFAREQDSKPAICCVRPKMWVDDEFDEGEETTVLVPYAVKWYRPVLIDVEILNVGPKALKVRHDDREIWLYRAQTAIIGAEEHGRLATSDALDRLTRNENVKLGISPYMAEKKSLIDEIKEYEVQLG